jgi:hypothetical protein
LFYHIAGCLIFLFLSMALYPHPPYADGLLIARPTQRDLLANLLLIGFFYWNYFILIPRLYFVKRYIPYLLAILTGLLIVILLPSLLTGRIPWSHHPPANLTSAQLPANQPTGPPPAQPPRASMGFFEEINHHIFVFWMVVLFSLFLRVRSRMLMAEKQKLDAELISLKAQINPHFLFNALNSIYSLTVKKEDSAPAAVINLSGLMRYMITDASKTKVPLQVEIDYIANYVELQRTRVRNTAVIDFKVDGDTADKTIAPLLLIAFIENAFKYGINPDRESVVRIGIEVQGDTLQLNVYNKKVLTKTGLDSTGIGVINTRERLSLLYPGRHELNMEDNDASFLVTLSIGMQ